MGGTCAHRRDSCDVIFSLGLNGKAPRDGGRLWPITGTL
jgi:hypothetical protein